MPVVLILIGLGCGMLVAAVVLAGLLAADRDPQRIVQVADKAGRLTVRMNEPVQPARCANPEVSDMVPEDVSNKVVAKAARIVRIMLKKGVGVVFSVIPRQSVWRTHPYDIVFQVKSARILVFEVRMHLDVSEGLCGWR